MFKISIGNRIKQLNSHWNIHGYLGHLSNDFYLDIRDLKRDWDFFFLIKSTWTNQWQPVRMFEWNLDLWIDIATVKNVSKTLLKRCTLLMNSSKIFLYEFCFYKKLTIITHNDLLMSIFFIDFDFLTVSLLIIIGAHLHRIPNLLGLNIVRLR